MELDKLAKSSVEAQSGAAVSMRRSSHALPNQIKIRPH